MEQMILQEKYPVFVLDILKSETKYQNSNEIIEFFKEKINSHPVCKYIREFDHYNHTKNLKEGEIAPEIKDCKIVMFCFGNKLYNTPRKKTDKKMVK